MTKHFDLIVIGAGSGGIAVAQKAANYGANVALVEMKQLGGTCVNLGCIPKKIMWYASQIDEYFHLASSYGFNFQNLKLDFATLVNKREQFIKFLHQVYEKKLQNSNVTYIKGCATFVDPETVLVNEESYTANHIVIATGCTPTPLQIKGAEFAIDSDGFFALEKLPNKVAVVGSGYIGMELASILNQLGAEVKLLIRYDVPLRHFDAYLAESLMEIMAMQGIEIICNFHPHQIVREKNQQLTIYSRDDKKITELDSLIFAIGRSPRTHLLNLNSAQVQTDSKGFITTDKWDKTNVSHIYGIGDITGKRLLTPVAVSAGRKLAERIFGADKNTFLDYELTPTVIFTHPPIASIGTTEENALKKHGKDNIEVYKVRFNSLLFALSEQRFPTMMKLVTLKSTGKIIGCHLIGQGVDEMLQGFAVAIKMGATKKDFDDTLAIHPTSAEELVLMTKPSL